jgi:hypothetical protein
MFSTIMDTDYGSVIISVILGLGLASIFKKVCKDGRCVVIRGPPIDEIKNNIYKIDSECYKYTPVMTKCS